MIDEATTADAEVKGDNEMVETACKAQLPLDVEADDRGNEEWSGGG